MNIKKAKSRQEEFEFIQYVDTEIGEKIKKWANNKARFSIAFVDCEYQLEFFNNGWTEVAKLGDYVIKGHDSNFYALNEMTFKLLFDVMEED
ncbi:hypothetical protein FXV99_03570 [Staphylococcus pseudintermedius]|uniref:hypothetical protein n=1 Tax=Staphylococcus pseudintermedius TaxID=283734 RepID=UPI0016560B55|nr:hypothetical protein [Staphylococcus pseudintermedius]MBC8710341.1 hypothetical protein [Staphylococcus pseudintermedius]